MGTHYKHITNQLPRISSEMAPKNGAPKTPWFVLTVNSPHFHIQEREREKKTKNSDGSNILNPHLGVNYRGLPTSSMFPFGNLTVCYIEAMAQSKFS